VGEGETRRKTDPLASRKVKDLPSWRLQKEGEAKNRIETKGTLVQQKAAPKTGRRAGTELQIGQKKKKKHLHKDFEKKRGPWNLKVSKM